MNILSNGIVRALLAESVKNIGGHKRLTLYKAADKSIIRQRLKGSPWSQLQTAQRIM
ncbi:hypothetical protein J6590_087875, partial [Homalodisca vitripennis]